MKSKYLILAISLFSLMFISCQSSKKIKNVRELMEDDGWEYVQRVVIDTHYDKDNWILENHDEFDIFKRGNDYAMTRHDTEKISLENCETGDEHLQASYWINYYAYPGNFTIRADHARNGTGLLGIITKHYNMKANASSIATLYFNINGSVDSSQSSGINEGGSDATTDDIEEISEPEPQKKYKQCPVCYGSGRCGGCGGSGSVYNSIDYNPGQYVDCSACGGTGQCGACEGSGMVEDFGW